MEFDSLSFSTISIILFRRLSDLKINPYGILPMEEYLDSIKTEMSILMMINFNDF